MSTPNSRLNLRGAVDLGAVAAANAAREQAAARAAAAPATTTAAAPTLVDVTEATFQAEVLDRSFTVPVVVDLWATWCGPCRTLSPILERLAQEYGGRIVVAKVDVDAEPRIAQAFQVQSIPTVVAVVGGQVVPMFMGALPEPQVRAYIDELLRVAAEQGLLPPPAEGGEADAVAPAHDERHDAAVDAIERGDYEAAEAVYREILALDPTDRDAAAGLSQVALLRRADGVDPEAAVAAAAASPTDVALAARAADALALHGRTTEAFSVLIAVVRSTSGSERDQARTHLLGLFDLVGPDDPAVAPARLALANALF